jgi:hypothetical protein
MKRTARIMDGLSIGLVALAFSGCQCSSKTSAPLPSPGGSPATASTAAQASSTAPSMSAAATAQRAERPEGEDPFHVKCVPHWPIDPAAPDTRREMSTCMISGRARATHETATQRESGEPVRALAVEIDEDDSLLCRTPLDPGEKEPPDRKAGSPDFTRAKVILIIGGARIESALRPGSGLCGWSKPGKSLGLDLTERSEGELSDASGALLGAWSSYFEATESKWLARSWRFERGGPVEKRPLDEGGAFVHHRDVHVRRGAARAISTKGSEAILHAGDGSFAVSAASLLTEGPVPVFVSRQNGYRFSAVRVDLPAR